MKEDELKNQDGKTRGIKFDLSTWAILLQGFMQIGFTTLVIVLGGLGAGLLLDRWLGTKPWFTLGLVLVSIPLSWVVVTRVALSTARHVTSSLPEDKNVGDGE